MSYNQNLLPAIAHQLDDFVATSPKNVVPALDNMRIFEQPLFAIASADDLLWETLKRPEVVGPQHLSPAEWLRDARSVISCFFPFTERIRAANRTQGEPAKEWLYGRYEGAAFMDAACAFLRDAVEQAGGRAIAPSLDDRFAVVELRSNWSERHAAFIAGLGTFSLNRSLITEAGSAGRLGSVITDVALEPTPRAYTEFDEHCDHCGACVQRCPPHAINEDGKDNAVCAQYLKETKIRYQPRYGCGKCQTGLPCEAAIPAGSQNSGQREVIRG
jgi:epoxyqueuosine reductase